jgi:hypothetical protein
MEIFENVVRACKKSGNFMPAWESFVNTEFYTAIIQKDNGLQTGDFQFQVKTSPQGNGEPMVFVSEVLERLDGMGTATAIKLKGAELVRMLNPEVGVLVVLSEGGFGIPAGLVAWLRESMQPA